MPACGIVESSFNSDKLIANKYSTRICMHYLIEMDIGAELEVIQHDWYLAGEKPTKTKQEGIICPIHKKGDKLMCENFRAITILNAAYKVLSQIIFRRLSPEVNEFVGSYQAGFIDGRSTTDQIFTVRQILKKCHEYQVPTHHLFIDFKAAYGSIDRTELWKVMDENSFPGKLTRLIRATMDGVQNSVRIPGESCSCKSSIMAANC